MATSRVVGMAATAVTTTMPWRFGWVVVADGGGREESEVWSLSTARGLIYGDCGAGAVSL
jgi:hypothetical protein